MKIPGNSDATGDFNFNYGKKKYLKKGNEVQFQ